MRTSCLVSTNYIVFYEEHTDIFTATEIKAAIDQFKDEKLGGKKKEFVETVQVESKGEEGQALIEEAATQAAIAQAQAEDAMDTS